MLLSIIIPNFNYARYLRAAIDSALALVWPSLEVIVVDDGSTDDSRAVIASYGNRISSIFQENAGQAQACNAGFAACHGDVIIFLDADDVLDPQLACEVFAVLSHGVSKVQVQMQVIDAQGRPTGALLPQFRVVPRAGDVLRWVLRAAAYPTPPGSGNAYARSFLEQISPLSGEERASDSYYLAAAPYLGEVVTIAKPLVSYRVHGDNDGAMASFDRTRFRRELRRAIWRFAYARGIAARAGMVLPAQAFDRSLSALPYRLASLCLEPALHPIPGDTVPQVVSHFLRAAFVAQGVSVSGRAALLLWALGVAAAPRSLREQIILWRFASATRPRVLRRGLQLLRVVR